MRLFVYGGMGMALLGIGGGAWRAAKKKKFALLYASVALLLVMILLWWVLPVAHLLQNTPDGAVEYVHLDLAGTDSPPLSAEAQADVLAALRATAFSHGIDGNHTIVEGELYYHGTINTDNKYMILHVYIYPDGSADAWVNTGAPWIYRAADPALLVRAVQRAL